MNLRKKAYELLSSLLGTGGVSTFVFGRPTSSGKVVSPGSAMQVTAVWTCNKILGECVGMLPFGVYKQAGESRSPATRHAVHRLLHDEPNPEMSAIDYRMAMTSALCLWGNSYSKIARRKDGTPVALWPLPSQLVRADRDKGNLVYKYTPAAGGSEVLRASDVLHVRGMSYDGINGISPISLLGNAIGLAMALEEYASRFFSNGGVPSLVLQAPSELGAEAIKNIRASWKSLYGGVENSNEVAVLEQGMTVKEMGTTPDKAQSVESRKFQLGEIARIYRMPPHMLADLERATFSNIEQQSIEFVTFTLMPWLTMWEQAVNRSLFSEEEKGTYFAKFNVDALLRGDTASRYAAYAIARQWGWMSADDVRAKEDMNPIPDGGDQYLVPMNMIPADSKPIPAPTTTRKPPQSLPAPEPRRIQ